MDKLYNNIRSLCESIGITDGKLCAEIGVRRSLLGDLKTGRKQSLSAETLSKIADYFGVSVDRVLNGEEKNPLPESGEEDLKKLLNSIQEKAEAGITLMYDGEPINDRTKKAFAASLEAAIALLEATKEEGQK